MSARSVRSRRRRRLLAIAIGWLLVGAGWIWWAEGHPREERRLRVLVHDRLDAWFPEAMAPPAGLQGLILRSPAVVSADAPPRPRVLLVHGLDEPGDIWDDLVPRLGAAGFEAWEFRYPNDQGIDRSADLLAARWGELPTDRPVIPIGHSMGGLVIRDFVTRRPDPADGNRAASGAAVRGVILLGTPNQGSEWARLRIWLELRDQLSAGPERRYSLFAALRDGLGEAKIDLRPGSDFLKDLNARPWPDSIPIRVIGGMLTEPPASMVASLDAISDELGSVDLAGVIGDWWSSLGDELGDGVVPLHSLRIPEGPEPVVVRASHRGMIARLFPNDPEPKAIPHLLETLADWSGP